MQLGGPHPKSFREREAAGQHVAGRPVPWPALCSFAVAMVCFGAARIHASGSLALTDRSSERLPVATKVMDFHPNNYAPSAFADWTGPSTLDQ